MKRQEQFFPLEELIDAVCTCAELVITHGPQYSPFMKKLEQEIERHEDVIQRAKDVLVRYGRPIPEPLAGHINVADRKTRKSSRPQKGRTGSSREENSGLPIVKP
jgi:hypothetical protein